MLPAGHRPSILFVSMMHGQAISDNEIYLLIKYIKSVLGRVAKRLSYIQDALCLKVNVHAINYFKMVLYDFAVGGQKKASRPSLQFV